MMRFSMAQTLIMAPVQLDGGRFDGEHFGRCLLAACNSFLSRSFSSAEAPPWPDAQAGSTAARPDAATAARFEQTIIPHLDAAHNLARYLSRDADAAQDIVQEAFLRAFRSFGDFRGGSSRAWILTIVRNCHHNWWSERKRSPLAESDGRRPANYDDAEGETDIIDLNDIARDEDTPETNLLRRRQAETVQAVLESLPELLREVLVLRELEDLPYREIADVTAVPIGTVMSRLARARKMFETVWQRRVVTPENSP
jgi:RNA polymerase sigma factor (sigma-70 family)